ncbi:MAG: hypothetical protein JWO31_3678 [Phycisphaerales bacterium]|nr:hypothetical protein [Phycisphaerales bacterium]
MPRLWFFLGGMLLVMASSAAFSGVAGSGRLAVEIFSGMLMAGLMAAVVAASAAAVRRVRAQQELIEGVGELLQLRRWAEAAGQLDRFLSAPARTAGLRVQGLIYLGAVLARYQRFGDALTVYEHVLAADAVDAGTAYGLRLGRAMAMLREDHLVDADRAISELKRAGPTGTAAAGLALVELYRDVKTGHADDAVTRFAKVLPIVRQHLGHRASDAWGLVARAYDVLGRTADAAAAYRTATLLAPAVELSRRYPELLKLEGRYEPTYAPPEAA